MNGFRLGMLGLWAVSACVWSGCSSGGNGSAVASASTRTKGAVVALDGQSTSLSGVQVRDPSSGTSDVTDDHGDFDLGPLREGEHELELVVPPRGGHGRREIHVELELSGGGEVELRISIDGESVVRLSIERSCDDDVERNETRAPLIADVAGLDGHVKVRKRADGHQGFDVEADHLAPGRSVDVVVTDPADASRVEVLGPISANVEGEAEIELRTQDGDRLPFGVADVDELEGYLIAVRDATSAQQLLHGEVPALGNVPVCTDDDNRGDDNGGGGDDSSIRMAGEARLSTAVGIGGFARVQLRSRPDRGEERIEVEVSDVALAGLEVWLENPNDPQRDLELVGTLHFEVDHLEFERDTESGDQLPFGATEAAELQNLQIEVRFPDGTVAYSGVTPPLMRS